MWRLSVHGSLPGDLPFEFLKDAATPDFFRPAIGVKYLGASFGNFAFVKRHLRGCKGAYR